MNKLDIRNAVREAIKGKTRVQEDLAVPTTTKEYGIIKLIFRNLRDKGYKYSSCSCHMNDEKNAYYDFTDGDWNNDAEACLKKIIGYAFASDSDAPLTAIISSIRELLKGGTLKVYNEIEDKFNEVSIEE